MLLCYGDWRALNEILRVGRRRCALDLALDQRKVSFGLILSDSAMDSVCGKASCGAYAAIYLCYHSNFLLFQILICR